MELKGKQLSLGAKIAAAVFVLLCFVVMIATKITIPIKDVIAIGTFIALVFSPVDISLWLEKLPAPNLSATRRAADAAAISAQTETANTAEQKGEYREAAENKPV